MKLEGCSALITGASSGIGAEFARQLATRADLLVLVARRGERLASLRDELNGRGGKLRVHLHVADLTDAAARKELVRALAEQEIAIDLLINNAGIGDHGGFVGSAPEKNDAMVQLNIAALTALTREFLPPMIARGRGGILNVSSSASFLALPQMAVYAATKAYVTSLTEALRSELHGTGVSASALCPGPVSTEFNATARRGEEPGLVGPQMAYVPVEQVVRDGLRGIERNQALVVPGAVMKLTGWLIRLTPRPLLRLAFRLAP